MQYIDMQPWDLSQVRGRFQKGSPGLEVDNLVFMRLVPGKIPRI